MRFKVQNISFYWRLDLIPKKEEAYTIYLTDSGHYQSKKYALCNNGRTVVTYQIWYRVLTWKSTRRWRWWWSLSIRCSWTCLKNKDQKTRNIFNIKNVPTIIYDRKSDIWGLDFQLDHGESTEKLVGSHCDYYYTQMTNNAGTSSPIA